MVIGQEVTLAHEALLLLRQINWLKEKKDGKISYPDFVCQFIVWSWHLRPSTAIPTKEFFSVVFLFPQS